MLTDRSDGGPRVGKLELEGRKTMALATKADFVPRRANH